MTNLDLSKGGNYRKNTLVSGGECQVEISALQYVKDQIPANHLRKTSVLVNQS